MFIYFFNDFLEQMLRVWSFIYLSQCNLVKNATTTASVPKKCHESGKKMKEARAPAFTAKEREIKVSGNMNMCRALLRLKKITAGIFLFFFDQIRGCDYTQIIYFGSLKIMVNHGLYILYPLFKYFVCLFTGFFFFKRKKKLKFDGYSTVNSGFSNRGSLILFHVIFFLIIRM